MPQVLTHQQLLETAGKFGTPLYVYHAERITEQYRRLQEAFAQTDTTFFYACKALTNINVLKHIKSIGCNADCSSVNEVQLALMAGFAPEQVLYTSNNIAFSEIEKAVSLGVHVNIDSLSNLGKFGEKYGHSYPVGIRLRPNIMAGGNLKISTGHNKSKFGIPVEDTDKVVQLMKEKKLHIRTLHIHTGSEIKDVEVFARGIEVLFELIPHFPELEVIDLGGGFKVPYAPGEEGTDIAALGKKVKAEFESIEKLHNRRLQVWFEPGKFLVSEAGYFIVQVNVLKQSGDTCFAGVNSGLNHLIRPMFYGSYHHIENISNAGAAPHRYNIVGNICETDNFAEDRMVAEIREDDYLVFYNAGAYGFEMASNYNSRFKPAEVLVKDNKPVLVRRRGTLEDLLATQVVMAD
ncbi:diaminopimelate decarboxylase [Agriterribacter sp.]|uniref:diaminopimelate decarboxylase n=1 Tax=Agriterribacter sp. TaxID=2821509 RepID=UPI002C9E25E0|nr:diaminopimelate decarboxylase [Agriterribacter sp.]HRP58003.1 diaminopimelate decarboxylase [Agriterribacter sp.]